jgi:hypothetical protein
MRGGDAWQVVGAMTSGARECLYIRQPPIFHPSTGRLKCETAVSDRTIGWRKSDFTEQSLHGRTRHRPAVHERVTSGVSVLRFMNRGAKLMTSGGGPDGGSAWMT